MPGFNPDEPRDETGKWTAFDASIGLREAASDSKISSAVAAYQSTLFDAINNELRYDRPDKYKDVIDKLDKASVDKTNDKLYRGMDSNFVKEIGQKYKITDISDVNELKTKLVGQKIHDKSFMSTSRDLSVAADFARDKGNGKTAVLQIDGDKKGIEVANHVKNLRATKEKEFLIKRNSTLVIKDVSISKSGKLILYTEIEK
jgi:hypothetical protein